HFTEAAVRNGHVEVAAVVEVPNSYRDRVDAVRHGDLARSQKGPVALAEEHPDAVGDVVGDDDVEPPVGVEIADRQSAPRRSEVVQYGGRKERRRVRGEVDIHIVAARAYYDGVRTTVVVEVSGRHEL